MVTDPYGHAYGQSCGTSSRLRRAVGAQSDAVVYAIAADINLDQLDMFRSTDGGLNWTALGLPGKIPVNR